MVDWNLVANLLTGFGTTTAVIITLVFSFVSHFSEKKKKRRGRANAAIFMANSLKEGYDKIPTGQDALEAVKNTSAYKSFEIYVLMSQLSFEKDPIITFTNDIFNFLNEKYRDLEEQQGKKEYEEKIEHLKNMR